MEVAVGARLKWTRNARSLGRRNGQEFQVTGIDDGHLLIRYKNGKAESWSSSELSSLDYALVSTTYGAQGKSADGMIGALDRHVGRESFYVAVSRVKRDLKLYVSEGLERLMEKIKQPKAKENPSEIISLDPLVSQIDQIQPIYEQQILQKQTAGISLHFPERNLIVNSGIER